ncbi:MAG TPA: hypothetical protein VHL11_25370 [Phototrophicaceae bacterium]|jgi:hypothetical protein|nr:hypothetical protein [Phototrophicaceae bacterium]
MWQTLIFSFLAGVMGGNGIPHFIRGITKENYPNMIGNTPVSNFVAGWVAIITTVVLIHVAQVEQNPVIALVSGSIGVLLIGLFHSWHGAFGRSD